MAAGKRPVELRRPVDLVREIAGFQGNEARRLPSNSQPTVLARCRGTCGWPTTQAAGRRPATPRLLATRSGRLAGGGAVQGGLASRCKTFDAKLLRQIAALLWTDPFRSQLEPELGVHSLERQAPLVLLAGTIPQDSTRAALAKVLRKRLSDGPKGLEAQGLTDRVITDPGLLVLAKMLPRKDLASPQGRPRGWPGGKPGETSKKQQAEQDWCVTTSKLVATWCKRFYAAARAKEKADAASNHLQPADRRRPARRVRTEAPKPG